MSKVKRNGRIMWGFIYVITFVVVFMASAIFKMTYDPSHGAYKVDWDESIGTVHSNLPYGDGDANKFDLYLPADSSKDAIYCIGSVVGPHPFPMMVRDFQSVVGIEAREQFLDMTGELPDAVVACVGGGSNAMGLFSGFLNDPVDIYGVEPLGRGIKMGDHAASLTYGEEGVMHGFNSIMLKDENGDPAPVYSVASGLDYPSCGPEHAFLHDLGRVKYDVVTDDETIDAFFELSRMEGIIPAIESSHAVAYGMKLAKTMGKGSVLINLSGRGDKDMDYIIEKYGIR